MTYVMNLWRETLVAVPKITDATKEFFHPQLISSIQLTRLCENMHMPVQELEKRLKPYKTDDDIVLYRVRDLQRAVDSYNGEFDISHNGRIDVKFLINEWGYHIKTLK